MLQIVRDADINFAALHFSVASVVGSLGAELTEKIKQPLKFQWGTGSAQPPVAVNGFDVTLLVDVCKAITSFEAKTRRSLP